MYDRDDSNLRECNLKRVIKRKTGHYSTFSDKFGRISETSK